MTTLKILKTIDRRLEKLISSDSLTPKQQKEVENLLNWRGKELQNQKTIAETNEVRSGKIALPDEQRGARERREKKGQTHKYKKSPIIEEEKNGEVLVKRNPDFTPKRNDITHVIEYPKIFASTPDFVEYQWNFIRCKHMCQFWGKSRQIGFSYAAAWLLCEFAKKGENAFYISATKIQAGIVRDYFKEFALEHWGVTVGGTDVVKLYAKGKLQCTFWFGGTSVSSAQSRSAHVIGDEVFWWPNYEKLKAAFMGNSIQSGYKVIFFSAASWKAHPAYADFLGENPDEPEPLNQVGSDSFFRKVVTVKDAIKQGFTRIKMEEIRKKFPEEDVFNQVFNFEFLDSQHSIFKWNDLQSLMVDVNKWKDENDQPIMKLETENGRTFYRYAGKQKLLGGLDPSVNGDFAKFAAILPPELSSKKSIYRLVAEMGWDGDGFDDVANDIQNLHKKTPFSEIKVDHNGPGIGQYQILKKLAFTKISKHNSTYQEKNEMVNKMIHLIQTKKFEFAIGDIHIINAFLRIKRAPNKDGSRSLIVTERTNKDHADIAWAIMSAIDIDYKVGKHLESFRKSYSF